MECIVSDYFQGVKMRRPVRAAHGEYIYTIVFMWRPSWRSELSNLGPSVENRKEATSTQASIKLMGSDSSLWSFC